VWGRWGYTGTLGAEYVHYVVTDRASSPPDTRGFYAERLLYLPRTTYLISDHAVSRREALAWRGGVPWRGAVPAAPPPADAPPAHPGGAPDGGAAAAAAVAAVRAVVGAGGRGGAVLCSFNQLYKLTPEVPSCTGVLCLVCCVRVLCCVYWCTVQLQPALQAHARGALLCTRQGSRLAQD
jgi:hypothetical protein